MHQRPQCTQHVSSCPPGSHAVCCVGSGYRNTSLLVVCAVRAPLASLTAGCERPMQRRLRAAVAACGRARATFRMCYVHTVAVAYCGCCVPLCVCVVRLSVCVSLSFRLLCGPSVRRSSGSRPGSCVPCACVHGCPGPGRPINQAPVTDFDRLIVRPIDRSEHAHTQD